MPTIRQYFLLFSLYRPLIEKIYLAFKTFWMNPCEKSNFHFVSDQWARTNHENRIRVRSSSRISKPTISKNSHEKDFGQLLRKKMIIKIVIIASLASLGEYWVIEPFEKPTLLPINLTQKNKECMTCLWCTKKLDNLTYSTVYYTYSTQRFEWLFQCALRVGH